MATNTGIHFEENVFCAIQKLVNSPNFLISEPNVRVRRKAKYYSKDRDAEIEFEIAVEKYLADPDENPALHPSMIIIVECKDYKKPVSVDELEEFHSKLQQIGADKTKGIMVTRTGAFQKSALSYALAKGITLARILPDHQIGYVVHCLTGKSLGNLFSKQNTTANIIGALCQRDFCSTHGERFFSSTGASSLEGMITVLLQ